MSSSSPNQRSKYTRNFHMKKIITTPQRLFENSTSSINTNTSSISGKSYFKNSSKELNHYNTEYKIRDLKRKSSCGFIKKNLSDEQIISFLFEYEYEKIKCNILKYLINKEKMGQIALNCFRNVQNEIEKIPSLNNSSLNNILKKNYDKFRDKLYFESNIIKETVFLKYFSDSNSNSLLRKLPILTNYKKHCYLCSNSALHRCKKNLYIIPNSNYIICKYCIEIYHKEQIECYCDYDKNVFITYEKNNIDNEDINYCLITSKDGIKNEMIKCEGCLGIVDLNMKNGKLYCDNCDIEYDNINDAILYNSANFEKLNSEITYALIMKEKVNDDESFDNQFCDCYGNLFKGIFNGKEILVCEKCNKVKLYKRCKSNIKNVGNKNKEKDKSIKKLNLFFSHDNLKDEINQYKNIQTQPLNVYRKVSNQKMNNYKYTISNNLNSNDEFFKKPNKNFTRIHYKNKEINEKEKAIHPLNNSTVQNKFEFSPIKKKINKYIEEEKKYEIPSNLNMSDYKIIDIIGNGSYSNIYLVEEIKTKTKYAIKKIIIDGEEDLQKFKNIIEIRQTLYNKNIENFILPIHKYIIKKIDITSYSIYILMPLANYDWNEKIKNKSIIYDEKTLRKILSYLVKGFSYMQEKKIAHRDIKPANILILNDKDYYIGDFGESINVKSDYGTFDIRGTKNYMSPILEQNVITGIRKIKHNVYKSDVYSLGLCFVYAMTKKLDLFDSIRKSNNDEDIRKIVMENVIYKKGYSKEFYNILLKMITPDEKDRVDFIQLNNLI